MISFVNYIYQGHVSYKRRLNPLSHPLNTISLSFQMRPLRCGTPLKKLKIVAVYITRLDIHAYIRFGKEKELEVYVIEIVG